MENQIIKINFCLPSFTKNLAINLALLDNKKRFGDCYYENVEITSLYGSFPNAIWNGGRCDFGKIDIAKFQEIVNLVNSLGVAIRYTFTNCLVTSEHLLDGYCNTLMDLCDNGMNEVLINSSLLEKHLRLYYPRFKYVLSTTTLTRGTTAINKSCKNYDLVVADYRDVRNMDFLKNIKNRDKVEILLNESCAYNCQYRGKHYEEISRAQLLCRETKGAKKCLFNDITKFREAYISNETLYGVLIPLGYINYKIRGRELDSFRLVDEYLSYLIKPQYRDLMKADILSLSSKYCKIYQY